MILSIGMIVKNEEKYIERCLTALKPILDSVDSELIIADTGSTDRTFEIAKKFTDNVFHFEWKNDFSAARNSTLDKAKGKWYMFIDADEILQDCSDIIRFFNSGEYKKYNSATFVIRSYAFENNPDSYMDFRSYRLTLKREDVRFSNPIHEALYPALAPAKNLKLIADHYGYVYYNDDGTLNEFARKKADRNLQMLLNELAESEKTGIYRESIYNQIADCYDILDMFDKSIEYIDMGFERVNPSSLFIIGYYTHKLMRLLAGGRNEETIQLCDKYFSKENLVRTRILATDCFVYGARAMAKVELKRFADSIPDFLNCFDLYKQYTDNKLITEDLLAGSFRATKAFMRAAYDIFYRCCIVVRDYNAAETASKLFPISDYFYDRPYIAIHLTYRLMIMEGSNYNRLRELYYKLDDYNKLQLIRMTRWQLLKTDKHDQVIRKFGEIINGNTQLVDTLNIFRRFFVQRNLEFEKITEYITKYTSRENEDIWCLMMLANFDITPYILDSNFDSERCTRGVFLNYNNNLNAANLFADYDINRISIEGLERAAEVYGWAMVGALQNKLDMTGLFEKFGQIGQRWLNERPDAEDIPGNIKAAIMAKKVVNAREQRDYKLCVEEMRNMSSACPSMVPFVNEYAKSVRAEARPAKPDVNPEFAQLAAQVKQNIRDMIAAGDLDNAQNTLAELEELCPLDTEIELLKDEIYAKRTEV